MIIEFSLLTMTTCHILPTRMNITRLFFEGMGRGQISQCAFCLWSYIYIYIPLTCSSSTQIQIFNASQGVIICNPTINCFPIFCVRGNQLDS